MRPNLRIILSCAAFYGIPYAAEAQVFRVTLSGANEIPAVVTNGSGSAVVTINPTTHELRVAQNFTGLTGLTTASHIHCCAVQPANVGVATTTPSFVGFPLGVTAGSQDRTYDMRLASTWNPAFVTQNGGSLPATEATFIAGVTAGRSYLNDHTNFAPGGEIRGTLVLQTFAANTSTTASTQGIARALDSLGAGTGAVSDAIVALAFMNPAQQNAAMAKLNPISSQGPLLTKTFSVGTIFDQVDSRVTPTPNGTASDERGQVWMKAYGLKGEGSGGGYAGFRSDGWGLAAGVDRRLSADLLVGAALSYADAELSYRDQAAGSGHDFTSTQVTIYGAQNLGRGYADAMVAYARQSNEHKRDPGLGGVATGSSDGSVLGARIGGGAPLTLGSAVFLTPQAHLDWYQVKQDGYTESGGGALALTVADQSGERLRGSLGAQLDFSPATSGIAMRPFLGAFWNHDFRNNGGMVGASFLAGGSSFLTPEQQLETNSFSLRAGINFHTEASFSAALVYDATLSSSYELHTLQAKARWAF